MNASDYQEIRQLFDEYLRMYASRDDRLTTCFSDDFSGFTGGGDFLVKDREEWVAITRQDFAQVKDPLRIELKDLAIQSLSDTIAVTTGFFIIHLPFADNILSRETARLVLIFRKESAEWKISHSSISIPYYLVREGEVYPLKGLVERNQLLEEQIAERTMQLSETNDKLRQTNEKLAREIEEHKQTESANARLLLEQRAILDNLPMMAWLKDSEGRLEMVNEPYAKACGHTVDECIGKTDLELFPQETARSYIADDHEVCTTGQKRQQEKQIVTPDGPKWHLTYKTPLFDELGRIAGITGIALDISDLKEHEKEELKVQKLESLGVLAGGIAHDFNNILTGIMGNISLAKMFIDETHRSHKALVGAEKASVRATELARQLLIFARGGEPVKKVVSLRHLVNESVSLVLHGSNVRGIVDIPASIHAIEADEGQICQAFHNIIINATQAMPGGGVITVSARNETLAGRNTVALPPGAYICLTFTDEGCGISEADLKKVFDPYFTTKVSGNGLGLASTHSIITRHGGHIGVSSLVDKGTTFTIHLPSIGEAVSECQTEPVTQTSKGHGGGSILVMDDEEMIRELAVGMLEEIGYRVTTCNEGSEALRSYKAAQESGTPFSVVIMDLTIPGGMGGKEAAEEILALDPAACLIVSSGYSNDPIMSDYRTYGFTGAIAKPYRIDELAEMLRASLPGR
ncbi:response regulator [Geobacter sp. FeAm09]|uniref:nuclear transport factor 2 family protein n=1 Tax=Geobacter sp. FeAm09 TaxID=2597769 RepID=UPI0011EE3EC7|nr:nuclear transport factor 2 family protein [Geobacter sp. FeAm09]QEM68214.1 response regulator [Geobacter sp. FeAm09]